MRVMANPYQTSYQAAAELNQALGPGPSMHPPAPRPTYQDAYRVSTSPQPSSVHLLPYSHDPAHGEPRTPSLKRKDPEGSGGSVGAGKRRRGDEEDDGDDGGGAGAKHWSDDDKARLFGWLMAPGNDDHFNMLRSSKNNCLRECALEVFGGKKTFQALKGAFERAFVTFKQIYAFEAFTSHLRNPTMNPAAQTDRHRDWEKRILAARKAGFDVGSLSVRVLEQWYRTGWYEMFYNRWHGDPMTTKPVVRMGQSATQPNPGGGSDDEHGDEGEEPMQDHSAELPEREQSVQLLAPPPLPPPSAVQASYLPPPSTSASGGFPVPPTPVLSAPPPNAPAPPAGAYPTEQTLATLTALTQTMMSTYVQLLKTQAEETRFKLEALRRQEEREAEDARVRREHEKRRQEREQADWEHGRETERMRHRSLLAQETLASSPDPSVKAAAADYLKKLFQD